MTYINIRGMPTLVKTRGNASGGRDESPRDATCGRSSLVLA